MNGNGDEWMRYLCAQKKTSVLHLTETGSGQEAYDSWRQALGMTCGLVDDPKRDWCLTSVWASLCVIWLFALSVHEPRGKRSYSGLSSRVSQTHALTHKQKNKRSPNTIPDFSICHMSVCVSTSRCKTINVTSDWFISDSGLQWP